MGISIPVFFLAYPAQVRLRRQAGLAAVHRSADAIRETPHPTGFYVLDASADRRLGGVHRRAAAPGPAGIALGTSRWRSSPDHPGRRPRGQQRGLRQDRRGKGLRRRVIDGRHVLRNAMLPVATVIGLQTGLLLSGAVLTEIVFAWPGMGSYLYEATSTATSRCSRAASCSSPSSSCWSTCWSTSPTGCSTRASVLQGIDEHRSGREPRSCSRSTPARRAAAGCGRRFRQLRRNPVALLGRGLIILFVVVAVFAPWLAPHSPTRGDLSQITPVARARSVSDDHWLGLDTFRAATSSAGSLRRPGSR